MEEEEDIQLRQLQIADETTFRAAVAEFATFDCVDADLPFAFLIEKADNFPAYVEMLAAWPQGQQLPDNYVPSAFLFAYEGTEIVGRVSIRYALGNEFLVDASQFAFEIVHLFLKIANRQHQRQSGVSPRLRLRRPQRGTAQRDGGKRQQPHRHERQEHQE